MEAYLLCLLLVLTFGQLSRLPILCEYFSASALVDCTLLLLPLVLFLSRRIRVQETDAALGKFTLSSQLSLSCLAAAVLCLLGATMTPPLLRTALIATMAYLAKLLAVPTEDRPIQTDPEPQQVIRFERPRSASIFDDQNTLDLLEQGYLVCSKPSVTGMGTFVVVMTNKKAREIAQNLKMTYEELADRLVEVESPNRSLRLSIERTLEDDIPCGAMTKLYLRPTTSKKGENTSGASRDLLDKISGVSRSPVGPKACPFSNYKAKILKPRKGTILLIVSENNVTSSLIMTESLASTIVCTLSHEIKTFLNSIVGNIELLGDLHHQDLSYKGCHTIATCSAILLVNKLNDLFDYLTLHNKEFKLHCSEFELEELLREVTKGCGPLAHQRQIGFEIARPKPVVRDLIGDKSRILQLILSIVCKAVEFSDCGTRVQLLIKRTKTQKVSFKVRSYGLSMQSKVEQHLRNLSSGGRIRSRASSSDGPTEATQNLEALALQISQLICKKMGTDLVMKVVREEYVEMKFSVRDGFPSPMLHPAPEASPVEKQRRMSGHIKSDRTNPANGETRPRGGSCYKRTLLEQIFNRTGYSRVSGFSSVPAAAADEAVVFTAAEDAKESRSADVTEQGRRTFSPEREIPSELEDGRISIPTTPMKRLMTSGGLTAGCTFRASAPVAKVRSEDRLHSMPSLEVPKKTPRMRTRRITAIEMVPEEQELPERSLDDSGMCEVLVVDDNTFNRCVLKELLKKYGKNSIEATDGKNAVQLVGRYLNAGKLNELSLVLMDLQMPVMNGIEATKAILALCLAAKCQAPAIVGISADSSEDDRRKFMQAGINEFVPRPVNSAKVKALLFKYVRK